MKLFALLSALLVTVIVMAAPVRALTPTTETYQICNAAGQQTPECCDAPSVQQAAAPGYSSQKNCGEQFGIVKTIIPIIGIVLLTGGIIGAVIWERRRLS